MSAPPDETDRLAAENAALRQRVAELERLASGAPQQTAAPNRERPPFDATVETHVRILADVAATLQDVADEDRVYDLLADGLRQLTSDDTIISVSDYESVRGTYSPRVLLGLSRYMDKLMELLGTRPEDLRGDYTEGVKRAMATGRLTRVDGGVAELARHALPPAISRAAGILLGIEDVHVIGFHKGSAAGGVSILTRRPGTVLPAASIEAMTTLGAVAISRVRSERALRESEERYRAIVGNTAIGIAVRALDDRYIEFNDRYREMLGYTHEELRSLRTSDITHPDDVEVSVRNLDDVKSGRAESRRYEKRYIAKNGRVVWGDVSLRSLKDRHGRIEAVIGTINDITERKRAEQQQRLNEERLNALVTLNNMTDADEHELTHFAMEAAVNLTGSTIGYVAFMNEDETVLTMYAWSRQAMRECAIVDKPIVYPVASTGLWGEAVRQRKAVITNDYSVPSPWKKGTPDGHVHVMRHMNAPTFDGSRVVIVAGVGNKPTDYGEDDVRQLTLLMSGLWAIIRRKRAEKEKEKLQAQLTQAQKMESVGRLAGGVAHDFNNMLGGILGHAELAMEHVDPAQPLYEDLQEIRRAAEHSADLTRQLLAFARKQTVAPRVLDLNESVEGMLKMLRRLIGEDIQLAWRPGRDTGVVRIDPSQIDQILANLCLNARDAIAGTGTVTIETGRASFDEESRAQHAGVAPGEYVLLAVSDDGCGMDGETQRHLFEPFFTTKEVGKGTGLGLATVYGIVRQNNGHIDVYSEPGRGTTIKIYLPRHRSERALPAPTAARPGARGSETILLVEDEPTIERVTTRMLQRLGYTVVAAHTPGEAIRLAREHSGQIDLLLTDVVMPEMNGRELARNLLSLHPGIKRLFMSGYTANVIAHHGVLDEGVHFLQKPFSASDLAVKIREVLGEG